MRSYNVICVDALVADFEQMKLPSIQAAIKEIGPTNAERQPANRIVRPPLSLLRESARFLFTQRACEHVLEPTLDDIQHEYIEALARGRSKQGQWIRFRGIFIFAMTALTLLVSATVGKFRDAFRHK